MKVEFLSSYNKDLNKLSSPAARQALLKLIQKMEKAISLNDIPNVKKLKGRMEDTVG